MSALINNAGKVILAPVEYMPLDVFEDQLQVGGGCLTEERGGGEGRGEV